MKDGRPYRGLGANYFDLLRRLVHDPANTSSLEDIERLGKAGLPFVLRWTNIRCARARTRTSRTGSAARSAE